MGYRSEIAFCITVDRMRVEDKNDSHHFEYDRAKFKEMVGFFKLSKFYEIATSPDYDLLNPNDPSIGWSGGVLMFYATGWKWYEDYPLVQEFNNFWDSMQDLEGISGYFIRVGEETGDIDTQEFGDDPCNEYFHAYTGLNFDGEEFLGEATTDEEEQTEQAQTATQPDCAGANHATQA